MDERVIVDHEAGAILVGSVASKSGAGGAERDGNVEVARYSLRDGSRQLFTLHPNLEPDDHDAPALLLRQDRRYIAVYTMHNEDRLTRWRVSRKRHEANEWRSEKTFDWSKPPASISENKVTYSNVFRLSAEGRTYNFVRATNRDPNFLISNDDGTSWSYGGRLLADKNVGYTNAYLKYASNDLDRIDFLATEHHPHDFDNSIYHGYIVGSKTHRSDGSVLDTSLFDVAAPSVTALTRVFAAGTVVRGKAMTRCWTTDLALDEDDYPFAIFTCRANGSIKDHRFLYARFDGEKWRVRYLAKAGTGLWRWEMDYVGGAAVDPQDPDVVYISAPIDPRNNEKLPKHEIFRGVTEDRGGRWDWIPITSNSSVDNRRPVVPKWKAERVAVLWCRGTISNSHVYDMEIVGLVMPR
jgi:hypothetical protein